MHTFIIDIGKTNIKGHVLNEAGVPVWSQSCANEYSSNDPYRHFNVDGIWRWLRDILRQAASRFELCAINVSTHGACAVLLDAHDEPALPVMDYEFDGLQVDGDDYRRVRPPFVATRSPELGAGLNLGRQLWWLKNRFPEQFRAIHKILMYPQYWVYKLTGIAVTELTSLGCHTDLWEPQSGRYSTLVHELNIEHALPSLASATRGVGQVRPELAGELGLSSECRVFAGVHDSNASFARYLASNIDESFTVMSTGTWIVAMSSDAEIDTLSECRDMLANVSVLGKPIACARFMGGREFEEICRLTGACLQDSFTEADFQNIVNSDLFAIPPFANGSGPFRGNASGGILTGEASSGITLATLYLALMMDYQLDSLAAHGSVLLGSTSLKNPLLCRLLAQLRPQQKILMSNDAASTIRGAWCLTRWGQSMPGSFDDFERARPTAVAGLSAYRETWRAKAEAGQ